MGHEFGGIGANGSVDIYAKPIVWKVGLPRMTTCRLSPRTKLRVQQKKDFSVSPRMSRSYQRTSTVANKGGHEGTWENNTC